MEVRNVGRTAIDRWLKVVRLPFDAAAHLLPRDGERRNAADLAIDRANRSVELARDPDFLSLDENVNVDERFVVCGALMRILRLGIGKFSHHRVTNYFWNLVQSQRLITIVGDCSADDAARHHQWEADPTCAPPGGESLAAVQARVVACVRDLAERHAGAAVVLVSHVGPIKALVCTAMDVPLTTGQRLFLDNATAAILILAW